MAPPTLGLPETPGISCDINKHQHTGFEFLGRLKFGTTQSSTKRPFSVVIFNGFLGGNNL